MRCHGPECFRDLFTVKISFAFVFSSVLAELLNEMDASIRRCDRPSAQPNVILAKRCSLVINLNTAQSKDRRGERGNRCRQMIAGIWTAKKKEKSGNYMHMRMVTHPPCSTILSSQCWVQSYLMNHLHSPAAEERFSISAPASLILLSFSTSFVFCVSCSSFMPSPQETFSLAFSISSSDIFYTNLLLLFLLLHLICIEAAFLLCANKMLTSCDLYPRYLK